MAAYTTSLTLGELLDKCLTAIDGGAPSTLPVAVCLQDRGTVRGEGVVFEARVLEDGIERAGATEDAFVLEASTYYAIDGVGKKPR